MKKFFITLCSALLISGAALAQEGLTVWTQFGDADLEWLQGQADSFSAAFGTPVVITKVDLGELKQKMLLAAPQGEAACLVAPVPHDQIGEMAAGGVLADMSEFATPDYLNDLNEQARLAFTFNGRLFGLPLYIEGPALVINTDLVPDVPATYEEMIQKAQELTTGDGSQFGFLYDDKNFYFSYNWINSFGGYVFSRDESGDLNPGDVGLANEGAVQGAQEIKKFQYDYGLIPAGTDSSVAQGLFNEGSLAMIYNGPWMIPDSRAAGINLTVMPVPPTEAGVTFDGFMGVQGVLLNQFCEDKVTAANFAKWLTRPDAQVDLAQRSGRIPSSQNAAAQVSDDPVIAGFSEALANAVPMPNIPQMGAVWQPMGDALAQILESPDSDVAGILNTAVNQIEGQ